MTAITFDTHQFVSTLRNAKFTDEQAEAISRAFKDAQEQADVAKKADINRLHSDMKVEMKEMELRLITRIGVMIAVGITAAITIIPVIIKLA
uniref:DUF1640 domain-containing protein n=1 Tax=Candidatus Kentrum sp. FW TaxID=2126338 RepID=A0A450SIU5_9GAMM|nr:MAG: hypothetical protein BECKFW1821B_GA0114236_101438 [Candidatus Kentron sp. FW]VFJ60137.1 MAG: hypothetical protein BECKFW1821A_GA0114235_109811 [Candidatus Kentron sp. FW]